MIRSAIITVLLVSSCFQTFSMVQAFESDDVAGFTQPFSDLTRLVSTDGTGFLPYGGVEGPITGLVPDLKQAVSGSLGKRDESSDVASGDSQAGESMPDRKNSGEGVATYTDPVNEDSGLSSLSKDLLAQLKKRYMENNMQTESELETSPQSDHKTSVSLLNLRRDLGINTLLGTGQDASLQGESGGLASDLGLRRRSVGLIGGGGPSQDSEGGGGTSVSLIGGLRRRNMGLKSSDSSDDQQKTTDGGHTQVSLLDLRRRQLLSGLVDTNNLVGGVLGDNSGSMVSESGGSVSLNSKRGNAEPGKPVDLGAPLDRRSTSVLSGSERMDRARLGVVADSQADRRAVFYARDNGQQMPGREQEKKGSNNISLVSLRRRLVDGVVQSLAEKLDIGGSTSQGESGLVNDVTSTV